MRPTKTLTIHCPELAEAIQALAEGRVFTPSGQYSFTPADDQEAPREAEKNTPAARVDQPESHRSTAS